MTSPESIPRQCMFCGCVGRSKEHLWPKWAHDLLPGSESTSLVTFNKKGKEEYTVDKVVEFSKSILETVVNRPCETCNSGWMSGLESSVRKIIEPIMRGEPVWLDDQELVTLREWITMKLMVLDQSSDAIMNAAERKAFFERRQLPENLQLTLFHCGLDEWRNNWATDQDILAPTGTLKKPDGATVKLMVWGFGDLLVRGLYRRGVEFPTMVPDNSYQEIWPGLTDRMWPPTHRLNAEEARSIRRTLFTLRQSPGVGPGLVPEASELDTR